MRTGELFMSWAMLFNHPVNICYYLLDYLVSTARKKPNDKVWGKCEQRDQ